MDVSKIVAEIDAKISSLQQAREVLLNLDGDIVDLKPRRGRPRGSSKGSKSSVAKKSSKPAASKRNLSPEGRKRIADAMKRRWAERRKDASTSAQKTPAKKQPRVLHSA